MGYSPLVSRVTSKTEHDKMFRHANAVTSGSNPSGRSSGASLSTNMIEQTPDEATDDWIATATNEQSSETVRGYRTIVNLWTDFCDEQGIEVMSEVTGADLMAFKRSLMSDDIATTTVGQYLSVLRSFIQHCEQVEYVRDGLAEKAPDASAPDGTRDEKIDTGTAEAILDYCEQFQYASRQHVEFAICWETAMRAGAMRSIDISDCYLDDDAPQIELVHRPDTDTPLKNQEESERRVNISREVAAVIRDYIDRRRLQPESVEDGRKPLLTTRAGRVTYNTILRDFRGLTRPCVYENECPDDRDPEECPATGGKRNANECPDSVSCHPVRRGSITHRHLDHDIHTETISGRCDLSEEVMSRHYDRQDEETKAQIRRENLDL